jgi:hypothetical protein
LLIAPIERERFPQQPECVKRADGNSNVVRELVLAFPALGAVIVCNHGGGPAFRPEGMAMLSRNFAAG